MFTPTRWRLTHIDVRIREEIEEALNARLAELEASGRQVESVQLDLSLGPSNRTTAWILYTEAAVHRVEEAPTCLNQLLAWRA